MRNILLMASILSLSASLAAQIGGERETLFQASRGYAVGNAGDIDGDGFNDYIVGKAGQAIGGLLNVGTASVYSSSNGALLYTYDGSLEHGKLGTYVCGAGDFDGDGRDDFMIASPGLSNAGLVENGLIQIFSGATGVPILEIPGLGYRHYLGESMLPIGDINQDGQVDLLGSAIFAAPGGNMNVGTLYAFSGVDGSVLYSIDGEPSDFNFGKHLSGLGDVNQDGIDDFMVTSPNNETFVPLDSGSLWVFSGADGSEIYRINGTESYDRVGNSSSGIDDLDGDGIRDIILTNDGQIEGRSGVTGNLLFTIPYDSSTYPTKNISEVGDLNGDGVPDFGGCNNRTLFSQLHIFSGATFEVILSEEVFNSANYSTLAPMGDLNGNGRDAFLTSELFSPLPPVAAFSHSPFLATSQYQVSAANGQTVDLTLDFPDAAGAYEYSVLFSTWITSNNPVTYGVEIPLGLSEYLFDSAQGIYPIAIHSGLQGVLDSAGDATASFSTPSGLPSSLLGFSLYVSAVAFPSGQLPEFSAVAVPITVVP